METQHPHLAGHSAEARPADSLTFRRLDGGSSGELLALMRAIANENGSHKSAILDERLWRWQYVDLPSKDARVYGAFEGSRLVGYYHAPIYRVSVRGRVLRAAVPQDVAVSSSMRGKGLFRRLATYATDDLGNSGVDLAYTFPNKNSIRTFLKYNGYTQLATLDPWVLPVDAGAVAASRLHVPGAAFVARAAINPLLRVLSRRAARREDIVVERASGGVGEAFAAFPRELSVHVVRSPEHLAWRFGARPNADFAFAGLRRGSETSAVVVCKLDTVFGVQTLIVMDVAHRPGKQEDLVALLAGLARHGRAALGWDFGLMFAAGTGAAFDALPRAGFLRVPARFNPRPLNLLVRSFGTATVDLPTDARVWHVALGDWDVF